MCCTVSVCRCFILYRLYSRSSMYLRRCQRSNYSYYTSQSRHEISSLAPFYSLSESSFFDFRFSFFSFFFRFRSAFSSAVSPSCLFRFFDSSSTFSSFAGTCGGASSGVGLDGSASDFGDGSMLLVDGAATPFSNGALKSVYSFCHLAGVASVVLPYFFTLLVL